MGDNKHNENDECECECECRKANKYDYMCLAPSFGKMTLKEDIGVAFDFIQDQDKNQEIGVNMTDISDMTLDSDIKNFEFKTYYNCKHFASCHLAQTTCKITKTK